MRVEWLENERYFCYTNQSTSCPDLSGLIFRDFFLEEKSHEIENNTKEVWPKCCYLTKRDREQNTLSSRQFTENWSFCRRCLIPTLARVWALPPRATIQVLWCGNVFLWTFLERRMIRVARKRDDDGTSNCSSRNIFIHSRDHWIVPTRVLSTTVKYHFGLFSTIQPNWWYSPSDSSRRKVCNVDGVIGEFSGCLTPLKDCWWLVIKIAEFQGPENCFSIL